MLDSKGTIHKKRNDLNKYKMKIAEKTNAKMETGELKDVLVGSDIFVGVSVADVLKKEWVETMADDPVVIAMANPNPEISFGNAKKTKIKVFFMQKFWKKL